VTPETKTYSAAEAAQLLEFDWRFQTQGEPLQPRAARGPPESGLTVHVPPGLLALSAASWPGLNPVVPVFDGAAQAPLANALVEPGWHLDAHGAAHD